MIELPPRAGEKTRAIADENARNSATFRGPSMPVSISCPSDDLEKLAKTNALYALWALAEDYPPGTQLPEWLHRYVHERACRIMIWSRYKPSGGQMGR